MENEENVIHHAINRREVIATKEFNDLLNQRPELVASFLDLNEMLEDESRNYKDGDMLEDEAGFIKIEILKRFKKDPYFDDGGGYHLKVIFGEKCFFVKTVPGFLGHGESKGADEFKSLKRAKEILRDEPGVAVIDFQLGYQDEKRTCFVSSWKENQVLLKKYIEELQARAQNRNSWEFKKIGELSQRVDRIKNLLSNFRDVTEGNMLIDTETELITVLDVHEKLPFIKRNAPR